MCPPLLQTSNFRTYGRTMANLNANTSYGGVINLTKCAITLYYFFLYSTVVKRYRKWKMNCIHIFLYCKQLVKQFQLFSIYLTINIKERFLNKINYRFISISLSINYNLCRFSLIIFWKLRTL